MDRTTKIQRYFLLALGIIGVVWFTLPAFLNFWTVTATNTSSYGLGFAIGFALALYWVVILSRWSKL